MSIASVDDFVESSTLRPPLTTVRMSHVDIHWHGEPIESPIDIIQPRLVPSSSIAQV